MTTIPTSQLKIPNEQRTEIDALSSMYQDDFHRVNDHRWENGVHYWVRVKWDDGESSQSKSAVLPGIAVRVDVKLPRSYPQKSPPEIQFQPLTGYEAVLEEKDIKDLGSKTQGMMHDYAADYSEAIYNVLQEAQLILEKRLEAVRNSVTVHEEMEMRQKEERERQQRLMDKMRKEHERDQEEKNLALMKQIEKERRKQSRKQLQKKRRQELAQKDARMGVIMGSDKEPFGVGLPESEKAASGERKRGTACAAGDENDDYEFGSAEDDDDDDEEDDWGGVEDWHDKKKRDDHELRQNALFQDLIMTSDGSEERKDKENNDKKSQSSRFIHEYTITGILGKGGFGSVVRAKYNLDEKEYAIKIIPLRSSAYMSARQEITTLASLNHNFIVRYYHSWVESIDPYEKMRALGFGEGCLSDVSSSLERTKEKNVRGGERGGGGGQGKKERVNGDGPPSEGSAAGKGDDADGDNGDEVSSRNVITHGDVIFFANNEAAQFLDNLENDDAVGLGGEADDGDFMQTSEIGKEELSSSGNGTNKEWLFIQMEFCPNKTLQDVIKNREAHNDPKKAWRLFRQLLEAIDHIHKKGIIHRDLKPANIFIDSKENVKLGDFGLAFGGEGQNNADTEGSELVEQPSDVVGTFLYRSPEQAEKGKKYDSKADMYALGIILYELFRPFHTGQERANAIIQLRKGGCIGEGDWALGDKQQQQQLQHASDKRSNKASNAAKVENKSSTVTIIEELLRADPRQRPSAQMLLEDKRIPIELGEQLLEKALVKLSTKGDSFNHRVLDKLFSIEPSPAIDFIYDRMESQQRYSQAATRVSMNAFSNTVNPFSHANAVKDRVLQFVEGIFRAHGSNRMSPPLLRPKKRGTWDFDKNAPRFLDKSGRQVVLPFSLTIPYARFLAQRYRREIGAHAAEDFIRRHDSGKVFRNLKAVDTPKEFMQCCYDSAWVRKEEWRRIEIYESVEIIAMAEEIMESFPELGNGVIYVSHTSILPAIVKAALESTAKQSLTQKDVQSFIKAVHRVCAGQRIGKDRKSVISSDLIKLLKNNSLPESALRVFRAGLHCYAGVGEISSKWKERFCKVILKSRKQSHSGHRGGENIRKKKGRRKKSKHNNVPQQHHHHHSHHPQLSWKQLIEEQAKAAIEEIRQIMQALKFMNRGSRVVFDPGLALKEPMFKSGLIFQVCTYGEETTTGGLGEVIAIGGRYDELVATFSPPVITSTKEMQKPLEAIGLNLAVEKIIQAVARNDKSSTKSYLKQGGGTAGAASNIGRRLPGLQDTSSLIFSAHGANNMSDMDVRIKLAAKLWASGIRAEYRYPIRIFDLNIARQYCCDIGLRWLVETRAGKDQGLVRIRDASIQDRNAYFEIRREAVPLWILSHSGPSLSKLPGDTKASSGAQPQLASDLTTKKRATSGNVYPNIYFIPNYIQKHASIGEKLLECLAGMHVQVNQDVKLVAVNLRILEIRELMSKVMDGQQAAYICPKKFKGNDPRRLLVKYACGIRTKSIRALFIYSILDGKVDVVQL